MLFPSLLTPRQLELKFKMSMLDSQSIISLKTLKRRCEILHSLIKTSPENDMTKLKRNLFTAKFSLKFGSIFLVMQPAGLSFWEAGKSSKPPPQKNPKNIIFAFCFGSVCSILKLKLHKSSQQEEYNQKQHTSFKMNIYVLLFLTNSHVYGLNCSLAES